MFPVNWFAGCVQLWFSIAITKTFLISWALALTLPSALTSARDPSVRRHLTSIINDTSIIRNSRHGSRLHIQVMNVIHKTYPADPIVSRLLLQNYDRECTDGRF